MKNEKLKNLILDELKKSKIVQVDYKNKIP